MSIILSGTSRETIDSLVASGAKVIARTGDTVEITFKKKPKPNTHEDFFLAEDKETP